MKKEAFILQRENDEFKRKLITKNTSRCTLQIRKETSEEE